jgi:integrase
MATKRFKDGKWRYTVRRFKLLPKAIYLSFDSEKEGDEYVAHLEGLLDRGIIPEGFLDQTLRKLTISKAMAMYLTEGHPSKSDAAVLTSLHPVIGSLQVSDITLNWVMNWVASMKREKRVSPTTIRHNVGAMARCFDWVKTRNSGLLPLNYFRELPRNFAAYTPEDERLAGVRREDIERDRRLEPHEEAEIRRILAGGRPLNKERGPDSAEDLPAMLFMFELALESAMRMREIYTLTREQIDLKRRTIFLVKTKNGDKRQVPITSVAGKAIRQYLVALEKGKVLSNKHDSSFIFPWYDGLESSLRPTTAMLSRRFARIFAMAGCPDFRFHDLRHEATSRLYEKTELSDLEIGKITGHRSMIMLRRYANLRGSELAGRLW